MHIYAQESSQVEQKMTSKLKALLFHPLFTLCLTLILTLFGLLVPGLPATWEKVRDPVAIFISFAGMAITWYLSASQTVHDYLAKMTVGFSEQKQQMLVVSNTLSDIKQSVPNIVAVLENQKDTLISTIEALATVNYVGDDEVAVVYLYNQYSLPELYRVRDVMVRSEIPFKEYAPDSYDAIRKGTKLFLQRPGTTLVEIIGRKTDTRIIQQYVSVIDELKIQFEDHRIQCFQLSNLGPLMNFAILDYKDRDSEVLFGWSHALGWPGAVCRSRNKKLVEEFIAFYEFMREKSATKVRVRSLLNPSVEDDVAQTGKRLVIDEKWNQGKFNDLLRMVERGPQENDADLCLLTSYFINWADMRSRIIECLRRGVRIRILFLNPDNNALMYARFAIREELKLEDTAKELRDQIQWLKALPGDVRKEFGSCPGTLEIRTSDLMPSGFVAHSKEWAVVGFMPARTSYAEGSMTIVGSGNEFWGTIASDWKQRWAKTHQGEDRMAGEPQ